MRLASHVPRDRRRQTAGLCGVSAAPTGRRLRRGCFGFAAGDPVREMPRTATATLRDTADRNVLDGPPCD